MGSQRGPEALLDELQPLLQIRSSLLVAENAMARPDDEVIRSHSGGFFTHSQEVYEYCVSPSTGDDITACLRAADAGYTLNAVVALGIGTPVAADSERFLERIAAAAKLVVTRAYDGEGFVLWRSAAPRR